MALTLREDTYVKAGCEGAFEEWGSKFLSEIKMIRQAHTELKLMIQE